MEKHQKNQLINFVEMMGSILGDNIEIVLHIIEGEQSYIAAIENEHVSGRTKDSSLTELALSFIENKVYKDHQFVKNYRGITKDNRQIRASTYFIKDENDELEAMLCFNIDVSKYKELSEEILKLGKLMASNYEHAATDNLEGSLPTVVFEGPDKETISDQESNNKDGEFIEYFSESLHDFFYSIVPKDYIENEEALKVNQKIEIVKELYKRGYFEVKGTVSHVAHLLKVSEPSVYRYLKQVEEEEIR